MAGISSVSALLNTPAKQVKIQKQWLGNLATTARSPSASEELVKQTEEFLQLLGEAVKSGSDDVDSPSYKSLRDFLEELYGAWAQRGDSSSETALFIFSFKQPLFENLRAEHGTDAAALAEDIWTATLLLDALGLQTVKNYQMNRESIIRRQQEEMLELSTPVVKLWDGILALPMIGTLDSARTQIVMESLLNKIVETGSEVAILDITGVPTVDTLVASTFLKPRRLCASWGHECIISGVRPQM